MFDNIVELFLVLFAGLEEMPPFAQSHETFKMKNLKTLVV
jgi:hypothetical protein